MPKKEIPMKKTFAYTAFAGSGHDKDKDPAHIQETISTLRQASAALKPTNADLANKLDDMANKKQEWLDKKDK